MYSYLFFGLIVLGLFSIIENIKGIKEISLIKLYFLIFLFSITINSAIDFSNELGSNLSLYGAIFRLFTTIAIVNLFYVIVQYKIPKIVIYIEIVLFVVYFVAILNGFRFIIIHNGQYLVKLDLFNKFNLIVTNLLVLGSMVLNLNKLKKVGNNNLYHVRIIRWILFFNIFFVGLIALIIISVLFFFSKSLHNYLDTRAFLIFYRFSITLYILFRPKFIDEYGFNNQLEKTFIKTSTITNTNFELVFYSNYYFLNREACLEDLALKLNHTKVELVEYLQTRTDESFNDLLNRSRINYLKELLMSKKYEFFTIEALSEMSGFNNRRTMYNAFKKYLGVTPTEFINKN